MVGYSFIFFHSLIQVFNSMLWLGLHSVVKYSFEFFHSVVQDFSSRLWLGLLIAIYQTNSFALKAMYEYFMVVKGNVHTVPASEPERDRN